MSGILLTSTMQSLPFCWLRMPVTEIWLSVCDSLHEGDSAMP